MVNLVVTTTNKKELSSSTVVNDDKMGKCAIIRLKQQCQSTTYTQCSTDRDCDGVQKCCITNDGCGRQCMAAHTTTSMNLYHSMIYDWL